jgi:hypothetical protein
MGTIEGCLFREHAGWFVSVCPSVFIVEESTKATIKAKPMSIDPVFWEIVGLPENAKAPLSFRLNGAWTCSPPQLEAVSIEESHDVAVVAARFVETANESLAGVERWSLENFLQLCRTAEGNGYLPCVVTSLVLLGRSSEALIACRSAKANGDLGGFLCSDGSFSEMAERWIIGLSAKATKH